jgi:hypothetical protein
MTTIRITQADADAALAQIPAAQAEFPCTSDAAEYLSGRAAAAIRAPLAVRQVIAGDISGAPLDVWNAPVPVETIREALTQAATSGFNLSE